MKTDLITRRDAVRRLALIMGGTLVGGDRFLRGASVSKTSSTVAFTEEEIALMDDIGDTIIPETTTPGAKAVGIGAFMVMMVDDCYETRDQAVFKAGLASLQETAKASFGSPFQSLSPSQRTDLLNRLDRDQRAHAVGKTETEPEHYFRMLKQLTLLGYFTSEIGATQALQYVETPGSLNGNAPYHKGDRNWFTPPSASI